MNLVNKLLIVSKYIYNLVTNNRLLWYHYLIRDFDSENVKKLSYLVKVSFLINNITEIDEIYLYKKCLRLTKLHNDKMFICDFEIESIVDLYFMTRGQFSYNNIDQVPPEIEELQNLEMVDLRINHLRTLPKQFGNFINIKYLNLYKNEFKEIHLVLFQLTNLLELDLSSNSITIIPSELKNLANLRELNLSQNKIENISEIGGLPDLKILYVYKNYIKEIPLAFTKLVKLRMISIFDNYLKEVPKWLSDSKIIIDWR